MFKKLGFFLLVSLLFVPASFSLEINGVNIPETLKAGNTNLILNGAGIRSKFFVKAYVGALYLKAKNSNPDAIINANEAMAIKLHITSSMITSEKMESATREGFQNSTNGKIAPINTQIEQFISVFKEEIKSNDIYDIIYTPEKGVDVLKNGKFKVNAKGLDFKKALFGIWLCDRPAHKKLKYGMLGN